MSLRKTKVDNKFCILLGDLWENFSSAILLTIN